MELNSKVMKDISQRCFQKGGRGGGMRAQPPPGSLKSMLLLEEKFLTIPLISVFSSILRQVFRLNIFKAKII